MKYKTRKGNIIKMSLEENEINFVQFHIPEHEIIPTDLRLKFNNKIFGYNKLNRCLGYDFFCYDCKSDDEALNYVNEIATLMCKQSESTQYRWEIRTVYVIEQEENFKVYPKIRVVFDTKLVLK